MLRPHASPIASPHCSPLTRICSDEAAAEALCEAFREAGENEQSFRRIHLFLSPNSQTGIANKRNYLIDKVAVGCLAVWLIAFSFPAAPLHPAFSVWLACRSAMGRNLVAKPWAVHG
jgi:hypothetical protein